MALRDEARDPWTYILGALAGGAAWAVGVPVMAAAGVGAAVLGVKAAVAAVLGTGGERSRVPAPPLPVADRSPERHWLDRAQAAVASFRDLAGSVPEGLVSERSRSIGEQSDNTLSGLRRLAGQATTTRSVAAHILTDRLAQEGERLQRSLDAATDPDIRQELERSMESVREQMQIGARLHQSLATLLARMESGTLGLERLVAQLAEILALGESATSPVEGAAQLEALADELEGLRAGLAETERLSRRTLGAYAGDGVASGSTDQRE
ncbi:MAG: hypothetical protein ABJC60_09480 [Actinomycetota bacterium]